MMQDPKSPSSMSGSTGHSYSSESDMSSSSNGGMQEKAGAVAEKAQEKVSEYGTKLQDQADANIDRAADGLEKAAEQMRTRLEQKGGVQGQVGTKVADSLDKTSQYLREHEAQEIWSEVESFVKQHPMQAALGAAAAGFVLARMMK